MPLTKDDVEQVSANVNHIASLMEILQRLLLPTVRRTIDVDITVRIFCFEPSSFASTLPHSQVLCAGQLV